MSRLIDPSGGLIARGGGLVVPGGGLVRTASADAASWPLTLAEVGTKMGGYQAPDHTWRLDNVTSVADFGAAASLVPESAPAVVDRGYGNAVEYTVDTFDAMACDDTTTMDIGTGDFMTLLVMSWDTFAVGSRGFMGKWSGTWHYLRADVDHVPKVFINDGTSSRTVESTAGDYRDSTPTIVAYGRRSGLPFFVSDREAYKTSAAAALTLSNATTFAVGAEALLSQGFDAYLCCGWNSTLTVAPTQANMQALLAALPLA